MNPPSPRQENIEKIRQACIKANDEIMELELGCKTTNGIYIGSNEEQDEIFFASKKDVAGDIEVYTYDGIVDTEFKILGRPIRLADVLLAMNAKESVYIRHDGVFFLWEKFTEGGSGHHGVYSTYVSWNLRDDDLNNQSEETINFIAELL